MQLTVAHLPRAAAARVVWLAAVSLLTSALALPLAASALGAEGQEVRTEVTIEAHALLGGNARPGSWTAVSVLVRNDGPALSGELRIRSSQQGRSRYGVPVELPNGARQEHMLYAQPPVFGNRLHVDLVSGDETVLTEEVPIKTHDVYAPIVAVVAERPEGIQPSLRAITERRDAQPATLLALGVADLPARPEAWSAIDRLVWQDVDATLLSPAQLDALRLWLGAGGRLVIVAGTTGSGPLRGFPQELLPFVPSDTIEVDPAELISLLGELPGGAGAIPALTGSLARGSALAMTAGGQVIAAQASWGQGTVVLLGINPAESWLANSDAAEALWRRLVPLATLNPLTIPDDSVLVGALNNLPSVQLPPIEQLFLLLITYIALIGPVNYLVLRRLDRREWAWITMPLIVVIFAVASYGMGARLKGSDVIVNEVAIVRAGEGTAAGVGQVYVGIFSPSRRSFDVRVPGGALLSNPVSQSQFGQAEQALDVLFGDPSRLRNFEVGFGVVRGFRAETAVAAPAIESELRLVRGKLEGTVRNNSDQPLERVSVLYGGGAAVLGDLGPNETRSVALDTTQFSFDYALSERLFGSTTPRDQDEARRIYSRRAILDQLIGYETRIAGAASDKPVLLGWRSGSVLDIELAGEQPNRVGDSLFVVPLPLAVDGAAVFADQLIQKTILEVSGEGWGEGSSYYMGRGTMIIEARPVTLQGVFAPSSLELALTEGEMHQLLGSGTEIEPLPEEQQPDQDDPAAPSAQPNNEPRWQPLPSLQLFDHAGARWFEFPELDMSRSYRIADPERFVDSSGRVLARFVNRGGIQEERWFNWTMRLEGTIQ